MNRITLRPVRCSGGRQGTSSAQITWLTASGQLEPGDRLPTVRRLAEYLSINLHTVCSTYQKSEMQGLVETRRGRGTHVLPFDPRLVAQAAGPLCSHAVGVIVAGWGNSFYHAFISSQRTGNGRMGLSCYWRSASLWVEHDPADAVFARVGHDHVAVGVYSHALWNAELCLAGRPSAPPGSPLPASVVTVSEPAPSGAITRMQWLPVSVT